MSAALRLVDCLPTLRPTLGPSMRPTLVPTANPTVQPTLVTPIRATEPPATQRSATVSPRVEAAARHEAKSLLAVMRLNADFLAALLASGDVSPIALDALEDLQRGIERLEQRFAASPPVVPRSR